MSDGAGAASVITLPKGGGAQKGLGETFSPDLHTGTGNFTVPLALPPGRNGFQPALSLVYSTGHGNGPFGLGWALGIPGVTRKTSRGIPQYRDRDADLEKRDVLVLSGAEDLVAVPDPSLDPSRATRYRPRTEGLFARIVHHHDAQLGTNFWEVSSKDGLVSFYGTNPAEQLTYHSDFTRPVTPPTIVKPKTSANDPDRIFAWKLTLTKDRCGNRIEYLYEGRDRSTARDEAEGRRWDQPLLTQIRYADYGAANSTRFLATVTFDYEQGSRPDAFSDYRAGFEIRTTRRCRSILVETHTPQQHLKVRRYDFTYRNDSLNRASLMAAVEVVGFDDTGAEATELPPLEFAHTEFKPEDPRQRKFYPLTGLDLPATSLANPSLELVDLFGNGLPDVLEMSGVVRYWRNRGDGRFDLPRPMNEAPAGVSLAAPGVQLIDANGDGRLDLLISQGPLAGYYPSQFGGQWSHRSFQKYTASPSFDLKDPEVRLIDLTGDGVTDVLRSGARFECFFNDSKDGWLPENTRRVERQALTVFPNVNFSDPRVKFADMSGDGMQDILLVHDGSIQYWPNVGFGNWAAAVRMKNSPRLPYGYDPRRILLGDVDGDGLADLVYVDDRTVTLWINQGGNAWSDPITIAGTPPVSDMDGVRLSDILGRGIAGILWTRDATSSRQDHYVFLDLTGAAKPYLLCEMTNNMGAVTRVEYQPSTRFYLRDEERPATRWRTPLPFPVQVVSRVEVIDDLSKGKLATEFRYHQGYWDGDEREFRGFGFVEQLDTQTFETYNARGLHGDDVVFEEVANRRQFSSPTLTKTWFHQGSVQDEQGEWSEPDRSDQYWQDDPGLLEHTEAVAGFLRSVDTRYRSLTTQAKRRIKRDALRTLRGSVIRTELYALDGSAAEDRPYLVAEQAYGINEIDSPDTSGDDRRHIFFPHTTAQRTTHWERGDDPMTEFTFSGAYDDFGRPLSQTKVAPPRRSRTRVRLSATETADETRILTAHTRTVYARPAVSTTYVHDRVATATSFELRAPPPLAETAPEVVATVLQDQKAAASDLHRRFEEDLQSWTAEGALPAAYRIFAHTVNRYDGPAFSGLAVGRVGTRGALTRAEMLVFNDAVRTDAYGNAPLIDDDGRLVVPAGAPAGITTELGYRRSGNEPGYVAGLYASAKRQKYDFHDAAVATSAGLIVAQLDPLSHETTIRYEACGVLPVLARDEVGLELAAVHNYRVMQPQSVTDPNGNITEFTYTAMGLPAGTAVKGRPNRNEGDRTLASTQLTYDFLSYRRSTLAGPANPEPIAVRTVRRVRHQTDPNDTGETIETREYSDGFGRLLQTRLQDDDTRYGDQSFGGGDGVLSVNQAAGRGGPIAARTNRNTARPNVTVSGWQRYDNKGRVVEKYEPFFDTGWDYDPAADATLGQRIMMFYDPRGQLIRSLNPDGSEQRVVRGVPLSLSDPPIDASETEKFSPTPWEAYTYDPNDLAPAAIGPAGPLTASAPRHHHFTPTSVLIDAMGRGILSVQRNRAAPASDTAPLPAIEELRTRSRYNILGKVLTVTDALDRQALGYAYDLMQRVAMVESLDAGRRRIALNAAGNQAQQRRSDGAVVLRDYDRLNRPRYQWARDRTGQPITLRERITYGDLGDPNQTTAERAANRNRNRLGRAAQHDDEAGRLTFERYDFKGNVLENTRAVISDAALAAGWSPDWNRTNADNDLDPSAYVTTSQYDALNRPTTIACPADVNGHVATLTHRYSRAGNIEQISLDGAPYVRRVAYNAKGQRVFIAYGNGIITRYAYDAVTFSLRRMRTESFARAGDDYTPTGTLLQDLAHDCDLANNVIATHDRVPGCGVPGDPNRLDRAFEYDAVYRLTSTSGRERDLPAPNSPWTDGQQPNVTLARRYSQSYTYDRVGNLTRLRHVAPQNGSFTRTFGLVAGTDQLDTVTIGAVDYQYTYDGAGNMTRETIGRELKWDHSNRLLEFRETSGGAASVVARYLYDAAGMRVKKWVRRNGNANNDESVVYVSGLLEDHRWAKNGGGRNTRLHVMDKQRRVAIVRVGAPHPDEAGVGVQYHFGDHLASSVAVVDDNGSLTNREEYFPYGDTSFGGFARKRFRFNGKERDEESGLRYHGARYYAPWVTRWLSVDPVEEAGQPRLPYAFCDNRPTVMVDMDGKNPILFAIFFALFFMPNTANAPGPRDPLYPSMSEGEFAAQFALAYGTMGVGAVVEKKLLFHFGETAFRRAALGAATEGVGWSAYSAGSLGISDAFQGKMSPPERYAAVALFGMFLGALLGGVRGRFSAPGPISDRAMLRYLTNVYAETPVLQDLGAAWAMKPGPARIEAMANVLKRFEAETGIKIDFVAPGVVQKATGERGNYASLHSRPGYLQIERQVGTEAEGELISEITHELGYFYAERYYGMKGSVPFAEPGLPGEPMMHKGEGSRLLEDMVQNRGNTEILVDPRH